MNKVTKVFECNGETVEITRTTNSDWGYRDIEYVGKYIQYRDTCGVKLEGLLKDILIDGVSAVKKHINYQELIERKKAQSVLKYTEKAIQQLKDYIENWEGGEFYFSYSAIDYPLDVSNALHEWYKKNIPSRKFESEQDFCGFVYITIR